MSFHIEADTRTRLTARLRIGSAPSSPSPVRTGGHLVTVRACEITDQADADTTPRWFTVKFWLRSAGMAEAEAYAGRLTMGLPINIVDEVVSVEERPQVDKDGKPVLGADGKQAIGKWDTLNLQVRNTGTTAPAVETPAEEPTPAPARKRRQRATAKAKAETVADLLSD